MQLEIPTPEPVMVERQERLTIHFVSKKRRINQCFNNGWLSDTKLDAIQAVLRQQFPHDEGIQSVLYAAKHQWKICSNYQHPSE